jgi:hypothetical protein
VKIHDAAALESHLDGQPHRTPVNQLLVARGTPTNIKTALGYNMEGEHAET